jgi:hypothetical protein
MGETLTEAPKPRKARLPGLVGEIHCFWVFVSSQGTHLSEIKSAGICVDRLKLH